MRIRSALLLAVSAQGPSGAVGGVVGGVVVSQERLASGVGAQVRRPANRALRCIFGATRS